MFHSAVYKHALLIELNTEEILTNNALAARKVMQGADKSKARQFVMICVLTRL